MLTDDARIILLIAGRSLQNASRFCDILPGNAGRVPLYFDRTGDVEYQLRDIMPDLVVDATGPFQLYGDDPYSVVKACLAIGIDYMDYADGTAFVNGFAQFDEQAQQRGLFALTGVSSFPVLSAAVVRRLARDMSRVTDIKAGIAPSPFAGVGANVVKAIASYAGKPLQVLHDGKAVSAYPLTESIRYTIAPPGRKPLRNLHFSLVDVPDQHVLPPMWPHLQSIWVGAATVPQEFLYLLNYLAWLVRLRLLPSLMPLAKLMHLVAQGWRWGEHRGGMFVAVSGLDANAQTFTRSWHLLAEGDKGPNVPSMAIAALARRCLNGKRPASGARVALTELELEDFESQFHRHGIDSGERIDQPTNAQAPLYVQILGNAWDRLPQPIRAMHDNLGSLQVSGKATIERGTSLVSRIAARIIGFPDAGTDVPVDVQFDVHGDVERWQRTFAGQRFLSTQRVGTGRSDRLIEERFGPLRFGLALVLEEEKLYLVVRRWSFLGLSLPAALAPTGNTYEHVEEGRFCFHVEIAHRWIGLVVRYRGWLLPTNEA